MSGETKVSILIPVYNRGDLISYAIESALSQSYEDIEIIVVDNASEDNTWEVVNEYSKKDNRIKAFRNHRNIGPVRNWIRCVENATGFYGKILWSDDIIAPDFIEKTLPMLKSDVGFVYTQVNVFKEDSIKCRTLYKNFKTGEYPSDKYINFAILDKGVPVSPGCALFRMEDIRRNLWLNIPNKVDSNFGMHAIGNDLLLFLLTAKDYPKFSVVNKPLSLFRHHKHSISISSEKGKLPLHYALVKSFFVENYKVEYLYDMAARIRLLLFIYPVAKRFNMHSVSDFFSKEIRVTNYMLVKSILSKFAFKMFNYLLRVVGK